MAQQVAAVGSAPPGTGIELRGANRQIFGEWKHHEQMCAGAAETGKTFACCLKLHIACQLVHGLNALMVRKNFNALAGTVVLTFQRITQNQGVEPYGGKTPTRFIYNNGSTVWLGGMDNPDACLSAERGVIYVNQAEELTLDDWEKLSTRCTGRGSNISNGIIYGDCNPSHSRHWIKGREASGVLKVFHSIHRDNPSLFDSAGNITEQGVKTLAALENLTGARKLRLLHGIWANAEGAVYEAFNSDSAHGHVCERLYSEMVAFYLAIDFGFTHPCAILLVGVDEDRRLHIFQEFYKTEVLPVDLVAKAAEWQKERLCEAAACDEARADLIASLQMAGISAIGVPKGTNSILDGIGLVQNRLKFVKKDVLLPRWPDGRPRLTVSSNCVNTIREVEAYRWGRNAEGATRDKPVDEDNHALDALRYLCMMLATGLGAFNTGSAVNLPQHSSGRRFVSQRRFTPRRF